MSEEFDEAEYSFVVKRRGNPQKPWRWEIYCAGKSAPVERSPVFTSFRLWNADQRLTLRFSPCPVADKRLLHPQGQLSP